MSVTQREAVEIARQITQTAAGVEVVVVIVEAVAGVKRRAVIALAGDTQGRVMGTVTMRGMVPAEGSSGVGRWKSPSIQSHYRRK